MAEWRDLADECRATALRAQEFAGHRAVLKRCYYAIYSDIAHLAVRAGVTMPAGWEGPHHKPVYDGTLIASHFDGWLSPAEQGRLISITANLYRFRRIADYCPSISVDEFDAKAAIGHLLIGLKITGKSS